jgi:hypothetical protein
MSSFVETAWNSLVYDIENTLTMACRRVTKDRAVTKEKRRERAEKLIKIGLYFQEKGEKAEGAIKDLHERIN